MADRVSLAAEVARVSRELHARGWVANHDGNVSARISAGRLLVTPTAISKGDADATALAVIGDQGEVLQGDQRPPSEVALHLGAYRARDDVHAVIHSHAPHATALACAGRALDTPFLAEAVVSIGAEVPVTEFVLPFGEPAAQLVERWIPRYDALLLGQHGVLTVGRDLDQALLRMELVEHMARIVLAAEAVGGVRPLPPEVLSTLLDKRRKAGLGQAASRVDAAAPAAPGAPSAPVSQTSWRPAGPAPAPDAWSGGKTEATGGPVYGATPARNAEGSELTEAVSAEIRRILG